MGKNKIITSQGNVQFITSKGRTTSVHPWHVYAVYEGDTVSFLFIYMKDYSGQAFFASQYEDLELNGVSYDNMEDLKNAINTAFAHAGAQARAEIVDELPEDPYTNTIYLVKKEHGEGYDEYIWNEEKSEWELIGDTDIEFERYLQIADFNVYSAATQNYIDAVSGETVANHNDIVALSGAVDTEVSARTDADTALSGAIDTVAADLVSESSARTAADTVLQNNINTANGRIDAEQLARAQADTAISGAVDTLKSSVSGLTDDKADKVDAVASAEYVSSAKTINFKNISGTVISTIDATDFVKDGMIEDVRIENGYLIIDFNTESGIQDISIPLTDIFNPDNYYDKNAIDGIVSGLNESIDEKFDASGITAYSTSQEVTAEIEAAVSGKVDTSDFEIYSGAVETALGNKFDASGITAYSTSQEVTAEIEAATSGKAENSDLVALSGEVATLSGNAITSGDVQNQIDAAVSGKQDTLIAGENITISGNVISSSGGGVDSGVVETMIEDYMTSEIAETLFNTKFIYANDASLGAWNGVRRVNVDFADEFDKKAKIMPYNGWEIPDKICVNGKSTFFIINSEYVNAIPSIFKDSTPRWIKINQLIDKPTKATDLIPSWRHNAGAIETNYVAWSEVSGDTYYCLAQNAGGSAFGSFEYTSDYDFNFNSYGFDDQYAILLSGKESDKQPYQKLLGEYIFYYNKYNQETFIDEGYFSPVIANFSGTTTGTYDSSNKYIDGKVNYMVDKTYVVEDFIYTKGNGININNNTISIDLPLSRGNGSESLKVNGASEANGKCSHAEGTNTHANGEYSHAEGSSAVASGRSSHAEGTETHANGEYSHAEGKNTQANNESEHASGRYNVSSSASTTFGDSGNTLFSVGNGTDIARHNAFEIRQNGDIYIEKGGNDVKLQDVIPSTTSAVTENSTAVVESGGVYRQMGGLKLEKITQSAYDALVQAGTVDADTLYIISD